jgi:20S proteasome alpha/beta subunit
MTVIVWDGKTLAADKRAINNGLKSGTVTKIHRFDGGLCGFSGDLDIGMAMVAWLRAGAVAVDYPKQQEKNACNFMVITNDGRTMRYETVPVPLVFENPHQAMGSGRDFALAALHLGFDARKAVEVACALDSGCGNGIDTLTLENCE